MNHTPEPWYVRRRKDWNFAVIYHKHVGIFGMRSRPEVGTSSGPRSVPDDEAGGSHLHLVTIDQIPNPSVAVTQNELIAQANAERIVQCVNAMAGIADPEKFVTKVKGMIEVLRGRTLDWDMMGHLSSRELLQSICGQADSICSMYPAKPDPKR